MIQVILLDDEEHALENLDMILKEAGGVEVMSSFQRADAFLAELQRLEGLGGLPNAVFIDIEMPEANGLEVAETINERHPDVEVVFVTAYSEYAVKAFELHSLDYLLKPTNRKRMLKTLARLSVSGEKTKKHERGLLHFQSMGEFVLLYRGQSEQLRWRTRKVKELCACLLHDHHRALTTDELTQRLFPETDSERAKVLMYTSMSYLRKSFRELGYPDAIRKYVNGYRLHLEEGISWDVLELQRMLDEWESSASADWTAVEKLMGLYRGDYFSQIEQPEFIARRLELSNRALRAVHAVKERYRQEGNRIRMTDCVASLVRLKPDSEPAVFELIQLYVEQDRRDEALEVYRRFMSHVKEELDLNPGEELADYVRTVLGDSGEARSISPRHRL